MIIDLILSIAAGIFASNFFVFVFFALLALPFSKPDKPFSSALLKGLFILMGVTALFSFFGDECDF